MRVVQILKEQRLQFVTAVVTSILLGPSLLQDFRKYSSHIDKSLIMDALKDIEGHSKQVVEPSIARVGRYRSSPALAGSPLRLFNSPLFPQRSVFHRFPEEQIITSW